MTLEKILSILATGRQVSEKLTKQILGEIFIHSTMQCRRDAEDVQITVHVEEAEDVQEIESDEDASTVELQ